MDRARAEAAAQTAAAPRIVLRPEAVRDAEFVVKPEGGSYGTIYRVLGEKPERWVAQTDFQNDEAVGYLAERLYKLGIEQALLEAGAREGDEVVIGDGPDAVVFDWRPTLSGGAEHLGPRGSDDRLYG